MAELEDLKSAFDADRVTPRAGAKEAALAASLDAYDTHRAAQKDGTRQGSGLVDRLRIAARAASKTITGQRPMHSLSMRSSFSARKALAGGASLAVLTIAVLAAVNVSNIEGFMQRGAEQKLDGSERADAAADDPASLPVPASEPTTITQSETGDELARSPMPQSAVETLELDAAAGVMGDTALAPMQEAEQFAAAPPQPSVMQPVMVQPSYRDQGRDRFETIETNPLHVTAESPVSTFSIDVDTSSYAFMRAALNNGVLPPDDSVRVEELINYFPYDYPVAGTADEPFDVTATIMPTPWNEATQLLHIGISGYDIAPQERPRANLVFLIDTSGSMQEPNKLPLLINAMKLLVDGLAPGDSVAIVAYAGGAGTVLEPTAAADKAAIIGALETFSAGGSTAGAEGIRQAYQLARQNFDPDGVNRVILATDGDFNVGITDIDELEGFVERERDGGVFLSVLGFGRGNYNDALMQALAQNGNGAAAYIDTLNEARKVLVEEATSMLFPIAKDVKIQVEFNPATVSEYRLIGYENRLLNREDFNNDRVDAGEIGSGHTVTAIYEITPAGSGAELVDDLRYQTDAPAAAADGESDELSDEYAFLRIRYKLPEEDTSRLMETPVSADNEVGASDASVAAREARFAAVVAAFGQLLRGGHYTGDYSYDDVVALASANKGADEFGYRAEFVNLVRLADSAASMERLQP